MEKKRPYRKERGHVLILAFEIMLLRVCGKRVYGKEKTI